MHNLRIPGIYKLKVVFKGLKDKLWHNHQIPIKDRELVFSQIRQIYKLNKYIFKQKARLELMVKNKDYSGFWRLYRRLMKRSICLHLLALHKVLPNWYKETSWAEIQRVLVESWKLCSLEATEYSVRQVEIPKPDGSVRRLSVPSKEWRILLWKVNLGIHIFSNKRLSKDQHGHRAGKGVMSCWFEILRKFGKYTNIFEFDFAAFHPSLKFSAIREALRAFDYPQEVVDWIIKLNDPGVLLSDGSSKKLGVGVPQGVAFSALLGMLVLKNIGVYEGRKDVRADFADDGVRASIDPGCKERLEALLDSGNTGVSLKEKKCAWIRKEGVDKKPLHFLGCEFDFVSKTFSAKTRSGHWETFRHPVTNPFLVELNSELAEQK